MSRKYVGTLLTVSVALLLLVGIASTFAQKKKLPSEGGQGLESAPTSRYEERLQAIRTDLANERARLGLDRERLVARYPTPEITLCPLTRVLPGGSAEIAVRGKFSSGTRFILGDERDLLELVKETVTPTELRAAIKAAPDAWPGMVGLQVFALSGITSGCTPVYIGGKHEWNFTVDNGWRIKLRTLDDGFIPKREGVPQPVYCAEFYRGKEIKPFEVRGVELDYDGRNYHGDIQGYDCDFALKLAKAQERQEKRMAEMERVQEQQQAEMERYRESPEFKKKQQQAEKKGKEAADSKYIQELKKYENVDPDKLSEKERAELMERMMQLAMEQAKQQGEEQEEETPTPPSKPAQAQIGEEAPDPVLAKAGDPEFVQESLQKKNQFCPDMMFWPKGREVEGTIGCGEERIVRNLKGTVKYIGHRQAQTK